MSYPGTHVLVIEPPEGTRVRLRRANHETEFHSVAWPFSEGGLNAGAATASNTGTIRAMFANSNITAEEESMTATIGF
jgi:hypothetical protein